MRGIIYRKKRGQMELSFGMIFSIILIIVFVAFTFFGIKKFLDFKDNTMITKFGGENGDLQSQVNTMWRSGTNGNEQHKYFLPSKVKYICFMDDYKSQAVGRYGIKKEDLNKYYYGEENMFIYPPKSMGTLASTRIKNINVTKMVSIGRENPYCMENKNGQVSVYIQKDYGENLVRVMRE